MSSASDLVKIVLPVPAGPNNNKPRLHGMCLLMYQSRLLRHRRMSSITCNTCSGKISCDNILSVLSVLRSISSGAYKNKRCVCRLYHGLDCVRLAILLLAVAASLAMSGTWMTSKRLSVFSASCDRFQLPSLYSLMASATTLSKLIVPRKKVKAMLVISDDLLFCSSVGAPPCGGAFDCV